MRPESRTRRTLIAKPFIRIGRTIARNPRATIRKVRTGGRQGDGLYGGRNNLRPPVFICSVWRWSRNLADHPSRSAWHGSFDVPSLTITLKSVILRVASGCFAFRGAKGNRNSSRGAERRLRGLAVWWAGSPAHGCRALARPKLGSRSWCAWSATRRRGEQCLRDSGRVASESVSRLMHCRAGPPGCCGRLTEVHFNTRLASSTLLHLNTSLTGFAQSSPPRRVKRLRKPSRKGSSMPGRTGESARRDASAYAPTHSYAGGSVVTEGWPKRKWIPFRAPTHAQRKRCAMNWSDYSSRWHDCLRMSGAPWSRRNWRSERARTSPNATGGPSRRSRYLFIAAWLSFASILNRTLDVTVRRLPNPTVVRGSLAGWTIETRRQRYRRVTESAAATPRRRRSAMVYVHLPNSCSDSRPASAPPQGAAMECR